MFDIAVKNLGSAVSDSELAAALPAFQVQVTRDFAPAWGVSAKLRIAPKAEVITPGEWLLGVFDTSDQAGALGYHDVTSQGTPLGKVFAGTTKQYGGLWTVTFSHELLEMLVDPEINLCALDDSAERLYGYEVCDAVEDDSLGYKIHGVTVSDFVLPNWFEPGAQVSVPRSFGGHVKKAFELAPGGYISYLDFRTNQGWQQLNADQGTRAAQTYQHRAHAGSRRDRRRISVSERIRSTAP